MGAFYDEIPSDSIKDWIKEQKIYFVATAPLSASSHVNVSPKGHSTTLNIVNSKTVWYLDLTGSGNETISHLTEKGNNRITIMFTGFMGPPRIVRLFGTGKVYELNTPEFNALLPPGDSRRLPGARAIIHIDIHQVGTSCGWSIPYFNYKEDRPTLLDWATQREKDDITGHTERGLKNYWKTKNSTSMDGMPGIFQSKEDKDKSKMMNSKDNTMGYSFLIGIMCGFFITFWFLKFAGVINERRLGEIFA